MLYNNYDEFFSDVEFSVAIMHKQEAHHLVGQAKSRATKIRPKAPIGGIFDRLLELP